MFRQLQIGFYDFSKAPSKDRILKKVSIEKRNPGLGLKSYFFKPSPFITLPSCLTLLEAFGSNTGMISHAPQSLIKSNMI